MNADEWQRRRSQFNHDWLKNVYLPALAKWQRILDGDVEDEAFVPMFASELLPKWSEHVADVTALLSSYEACMSPRTLLSLAPLNHCPPADVGWLGGLVHALWLSRCRVEERVAIVHRSLTLVCEAFAGLLLESPEADRPTGRFLGASANPGAFQKFRAACTDLSEKIHTLESRVRVV